MVEEAKAKRKAWRAANRERILALKRAQYHKHKDRLRERVAAKYIANRERIKAKAAARYEDKKASICAHLRAKYAADPERFLSANRIHRAENLDKYRVRGREYAKAYQQRDRARFLKKMSRANQKRRALLVGAFVEHVDADVVFKRDKGICGICKKKVRQGKWHIDHVVPLACGGLHCYENVQVSHARCNLSKQDRFQTGQLGLFQKVAI